MTAALRRVTLHLARSPGFPEGSTRHGYTMILPLEADGQLSVELFHSKGGACFVHRFWGDEPVQHGRLVRRPGGPGGATWGIDYDATRFDDDETGFRLGTHCFVVGEYVSLRDAEGSLHPFRVTKVENA